MAKLPGNVPLTDGRGRLLRSLLAINALDEEEKEAIYRQIIPDRLSAFLGIVPGSFCGPSGERLVKFIAPKGFGFTRIEARHREDDPDTVFFLDIADTQFHQMELSFCIISDPKAPRFNVDIDHEGKNNCFATLSRNIDEELRAMNAGLFPNQTRRGLRMFGEFFPLFERFVDAMGMEMIVAEPLTYDNAVRYEKYGFDYLKGRRLMMAINEGFGANGILTSRLDGSNPFRMPGMELTLHGRSWAIHDGILDEPWDDVQIYKMIGVNAGITTFPEHS
jgi:hypothetical protein